MQKAIASRVDWARPGNMVVTCAELDALIRGWTRHNCNTQHILLTGVGVMRVARARLWR